MDKSDEKSGLVKRKGKRSEREEGRGGRRGEGRRVERREEKEGRRVEREGGGWSQLKRPRGGEEEMSEGQGEVRRNAVTVDRGPVPRAQVLQSPTGTTKNEQNGDRVAQPRVHAQARRRRIFARAIHRTDRPLSPWISIVFQDACRPSKIPSLRDSLFRRDARLSFFSQFTSSFLSFLPSSLLFVSFLLLVTLPLLRMES